MKSLKFIAVLLVAGLVSFTASAADLIVEENAVLPNYANIQDALNAASDGDRIFVKNKVGAVPFMEDIIINVSVSIHCFTPDDLWLIQGSVTIQPAIGREVAIIGMENLIGSVTAAANSPVGSPTRVNVLGSYLYSGSISISGTNYISHIAGNQLDNGNITARYSTITGNRLDGSIIVNSAASLTSEDTLYIVGNRLMSSDFESPTAGRIDWNNDQHYFHIANNVVNTTYHNGAVDVGILKIGGTSVIYNNFLRTGPLSNDEGISLQSTPVGTLVEIHNNFIIDLSGSGNTGIAAGTVSGFVSIAYNVFNNTDTDISGSGYSSVNNTNAVGVGYDITTGACTLPECIDNGSPAPKHTDLDLTTNDVGAAGGSFHFSNFFPLFAGGARVYLVKTPRVVLGLSTIYGEADSYDR